MKITEQNFIEQLNIRNEAALEYVMWNYGGLVKSVVRRYLYNLTQYEEDCINEIFFVVWNHISSYRQEKNSFANWIAGVARLKALDFLRKHAKQMKQESIENQEMDVEDTSQELQTKYEEVISEETEQMLSCLKAKDRELFYRLYVQEEDMDEVSKGMNLKKSVIYNRLSRAKSKLRKLYGKG